MCIYTYSFLKCYKDFLMKRNAALETLLTYAGRVGDTITYIFIRQVTLLAQFL